MGRVDAIYVGAGPLMTLNRACINTPATGARLPTIYLQREYA